MMLLAGSSIGIGTALLNTVMGMGTVFVVLIFISFIISLLKNVNKIGAKPEKKQELPPPAESVPMQLEEVEEELADDEELVAVITAAICAYQGTSSEGFQVRSIKRAARR